jgi:DNA-binding MarR family transcriptional regulator
MSVRSKPGSDESQRSGVVAGGGAHRGHEAAVLDAEVSLLEDVLGPFGVLGREALARRADARLWHEGTFEAALRAGVQRGVLKLLPDGSVALRGRRSAFGHGQMGRGGRSRLARARTIGRHRGAALGAELDQQEYRAAADLRARLRGFLQSSERVLRAHALTSERYELLLAIKGAADGSERATVGDLAVVLGVAQSSVTQLIRRAEDAGLVRREVSSRDGRVRYLRLTAEGERQLAGAVVELRPERDRLLQIIT